MKLSSSSTTVTGRVSVYVHPVCSISAMRDCRSLLRQQPVPIARKIGRMIDRVEKAIERDAGDLEVRLREFVDAAHYVSLIRRSHSGSRALYEQATLMLGEYERSLQIFH